MSESSRIVKIEKKYHWGDVYNTYIEAITFYWTFGLHIIEYYTPGNEIWSPKEILRNRRQQR